MKVLKFGGTSVGTAENLLNVKHIVEANKDSVIVVVSALGGLTDKLIATAKLAEIGDVSFEKRMMEIIDRHVTIIAQIIPAGDERDKLLHRVNKLLSELYQHYQDVFTIRELSSQKLSDIVSYGERISSLIVTTLIDDACWFDSLSFIKTEYKHHKHKLSGEATDQLIHEAFQVMPKVALVPGFISTDARTGKITNLGRGGSDYTAAILAAALDADCLEIWTDVDGFMTADPRLIQNAFPIKELTYNEAEELCNYGAKVVYPPTIYPVWYKDIPVLIKNTMNPTAPGTFIKHTTQSGEGLIKGISSVKETCLISIKVMQQCNLEGLWRELSQYLSDECISVLVSVQRLEVNELLIGVKKEDADFVRSLLRKYLSTKTDRNYQLQVTSDLSTVAVVGKSTSHSCELLSKLHECFHQRRVQILTPCQEQSALTLAFMVTSSDLQTVLEVTHTIAFETNAF